MSSPTAVRIRRSGPPKPTTVDVWATWTGEGALALHATAGVVGVAAGPDVLYLLPDQALLLADRLIRAAKEAQT